MRALKNNGIDAILNDRKAFIPSQAQPMRNIVLKPTDFRGEFISVSMGDGLYTKGPQMSMIVRLTTCKLKKGLPCAIMVR